MASRVVFDQAGLAALFDSTSGPIAKDLKRRGIKVQRRARQLAPVDTGRLRSSIGEELARSGSLLIERVGTDVDYAAFQELGTSRTPAHPYLRPALDAAS